MAVPLDGAQQLAIGDGWWEQAEKAAGAQRQSLRTRAIKWYQDALPKLSGLSKMKVLQRLEPFKALSQKTGLWAMYYNKKGNDHMGELKVSEEILKLDERYSENSPRNGVGRDNFGVRVRGLLMIGQAGKYEFQVRGDDYIALYVDGKKLCEDNNKGDSVGSVELAAGQQHLGVIFRENGGGAYWYVKWKKPGDTEFSAIPASVLRYELLSRADYEN